MSTHRVAVAQARETRTRPKAGDHRAPAPAPFPTESHDTHARSAAARGRDMTVDRPARPSEGQACHEGGLTRHDSRTRPLGERHPAAAAVPELPGTTPAAFTRVNAAAAARLGVRPDTYSGLLGMAPDQLANDRYRTPASTNVRLWELMTLQAPWQEVVLHMARESTLGALGVWDHLITQAPTPLEGLRDAGRYLATAADAGTEALHIEVTEQRVTLSHVNAADLTDDVAAAIRAYSLALLRKRLSEGSRRTIVPTRVTLATRAPHDHRTLTQLYGTNAIDFASPVNSITFKAADLLTPQHHAPGLSAILRRHAEQTLSQAICLRDWLDLFRSRLRAALDTELPTLRSMSRHMGLSARTLQRRLDEHGTTWSDELQDVRREQALRLLASTDMTLETIARRAGYADAGGLRRAAQRWTGQPVSTLRGSTATTLGAADALPHGS
ncbi:helix-turn-helix domain-containing protein [Streptomyces sp. NPDC053755]|uniref:helix-turn-helix transcriptional regulator n=1 Tax=Streptomyces sp. NPDC053755 TaxID=3155815 RepID=UPI003449732A